MLIMARADVSSDIGIFVTGDSREGVIGLAYSQKEGCVVASGNLDDVSDQCRGTKTKNVNTWKGKNGEWNNSVTNSRYALF